MRKTTVCTLFFLILTLSITQLAEAQWKRNTITNQTTETLYVVWSTAYPAVGDVPVAGYRTSGWTTIAVGQQESYWAYATHRIYFLILKGGDPIKPATSTDTYPAWFNRNAHFNIVTPLEIDTISTPDLFSYSDTSFGDTTQSDGFLRYSNGSQITVTDDWMGVYSTEGRVHIPNSNLRAAIEEELGKTSGAEITQVDMLELTSLELTRLRVVRRNRNSVEDLTGLEFAANLTDLSIYDNQISDISALVGLTNLEFLDLTRNQISDISALAGLTNLTELYLKGNQISDFSPIAGLIPNLEHYSNSNQRVRSTEGRVHIPDSYLRAHIEKALGKTSGAEITQADMLTLTSLAAIGGRESSVEDLTGLEFAANLTELNLHSNQISNISTLAGLTDLTELYLGGNNISNISALVGLTDLTELYLGGNNISDISALAGLTDLTELYLVENNISDISALAGLTDLTELYLAFNQISDISALAELTDLTELSLNSNQISDFSPIAGLIPNLEHYSELFQRVHSTEGRVHIPDSYLRAAIEDVLDKPRGATITSSDMMNLTSLDAVDSSIGDLTGIEYAANLEALNLWNNDISDVSPLAGLINLTTLNLSHNDISDISPLTGLVNLTTLWLYTNDISDISPLTGLVNLTTLNLSHNDISDISPLTGLINLTTEVLPFIQTKN